MEISRNSIRPAVQTDQTGVFRTQVTQNKSRLFIRETAQPEKTIMTRQSSNRLDLDHIITRRKFLGTTALSSAALLSGGITSLLRQSASAAGGFDFVEKSILELQDAMASGQLTSRDLTHGYIGRMQSLNPLL